MDSVEVRLPRGFSVRGEWRRDAVVRAVCGRDEAFLANAGGFPSVAARATALLARCVVRLGPHAPVDEAAVQTLSAGDREALLLHVRRLTFGETMPCVLRCPSEGCGEKMDLDLTVSGLLLPPYENAAELHEALVDGRRARFRPPSGEDQEAAAILARTDAASAAGLLLRRCLVEFDGELTETARCELSNRMAACDPQAEILLELACPLCGRAFTAPFDAAAHLFRELDGRRGELYHDIHHLAFHYHWSETEILAMSPRKRRMYLELLGDALAEAAAR